MPTELKTVQARVLSEIYAVFFFLLLLLLLVLLLILLPVQRISSVLFCFVVDYAM